VKIQGGDMKRKHGTRYLGLFFSFAALLMGAALAGCPTDTDTDLNKGVDKVAMPTAEPAGGIVSSGELITLLCSTPGAAIYYTLDSSDPNSSSTSTLYMATARPIINASLILTAVAVKNGMEDSGMLEAEYTINAHQVAMPVADPVEGPVPLGQSVTLTCETPGATIYYTLDGSVPSRSGTQYSDSNKPVINVREDVSLRAFAVKDGLDDSAVLTTVYTYLTPTWSAVAGGTESIPGTSTFGNSIVWGIAYGGEKFVAGGVNGKMAHSPDGKNWTAVTDATLFGSSDINRVTYCNGNFIVGGLTGKMSYSPDGENWMAINGTSNKFGILGIYDIAYGGSTGSEKYVAVGGGPTISCSSDLVTWTKVSTIPKFGTNMIIRSVSYGNGKFVAVGGGGGIISSIDGENWTEVTQTVFTTVINRVIYAKEMFIAVGTGNKIAWSSDGEDWKAVDQNVFADKDIQDIAWGAEQFIAVGGKDAGTSMMGISPDGVYWREVTGHTITTPFIRSIAYGGKKFVAGGGMGRIAWSNDQE
jgi:hypothetical protein